MAKLPGTDNDDTIYGTSANDIIRGFDGKDFLYGLGGADELWGNGGADHLEGGEGNDSLQGGSGDDTMLGGAGNDQLYGDDGSDYLDGGAGADRMEGGRGSDTYVVLGNDTLIETETSIFTDTVISYQNWTLGTNFENLVLAGTSNFSGTGNSENNLITGNGGNNLLKGLDGDDRLRGEGGNDTLQGGNGDDTIDGGIGADRMVGGDGFDSYYVDNAGDRVVDSAGSGEVFSSITWNMNNSAGAHELYLIGANAINATGSSGDDRIQGNEANNTLNGGAGDDALYGGGGINTLIGGAGNDILQSEVGGTMIGGTGNDIYDMYLDTEGNQLATIIENANEGFDSATVYVDWNDETAVRFDVVQNIEAYTIYGGGERGVRAHGSAGNDTIMMGTNGRAVGGAGNDHLSVEPSSYYAWEVVLDGGAGNDIVAGSWISADTLIGGTGADTFVFAGYRYGDAEVDLISDYTDGEDRIGLSQQFFYEITSPTGTLRAAEFVAGTEATTADQRVIYDASTGALYYDGDGVGGDDQFQIGTIVSSGGVINNRDFVVMSEADIYGA